MSAQTVARLLLVEDETILRGLVSQFLALENYEVATAENGRAAVNAYADAGPFDLILLDLNLPILSGVEACRQIKLMNAEQPFLVCSAAVLDSHLLALAAMGVTEVLGKPYHPGELLKRISAILNRRETDISTHAAHAGTTRARRRITPARALSDARPFD